MWLFTKFGMVSVVCARVLDAKGRVTTKVDQSRLMIRARRRSHLNALLAGTSLECAEVLDTRNADYRYRVFATREEFSQVLERVSEQLDYGNFKGECHKRAEAGMLNHNFVSCLHRVWNAAFEWLVQRPEPKFGGNE